MRDDDAIGAALQHYNHHGGALGSAGASYPLRMWEAYGVMADAAEYRREIERQRRANEKDFK